MVFTDLLPVYKGKIGQKLTYVSLSPRNPLVDLLLVCEEDAPDFMGGFGEGALFSDWEDDPSMLPVRLNTNSEVPLTEEPPLRPNMVWLLT